MAFCTISNWSTTDWTDEMETLAREKYVPLVKSVGATSVKMVRTGDHSFIVVTEYADKAASDAAAAKIADIRSQATDEMPMSMDSRLEGAVFAAG